MSGTSQQTEYHYIVSIQLPGGVMNTQDGSLSIPTGFTRAAAFRFLMNQLTEKYGPTLTVLFFSFEPNQL
ncbi:hypothetical protein ACIOEX_01440 [Streptomyces sp. NPDC087850]|uniref:hypothetical protein n=1 Tax=Streptomyces sp. NPDC087850 TaxID=3365809 RepID=UPI00381AD3F7